MGRVELVEMPERAALLDHSHSSPHVLIVLGGRVLEDGRTYHAGDVRFSSADDRHFLRFQSSTRCVVIETTLHEGSATRSVIRAPELARDVRPGRDLDWWPRLVADLEPLLPCSLDGTQIPVQPLEALPDQVMPRYAVSAIEGPDTLVFFRRSQKAGERLL